MKKVENSISQQFSFINMQLRIQHYNTQFEYFLTFIHLLKVYFIHFQHSNQFSRR